MPDSAHNELVIFSEARQLPPEQRAAYLNQACAGNPDLSRRLEELLQSADETATFMETPVVKSLSPNEFLRASNPAEKPGDRIGSYELIAQIGEGGCGVVYKASQEQPVRRVVALKIIKLGMDTKSVIARFEAERQALALMDHPNIARVLDAGTTDTGRPYFVMELVEGVKITDFCDRNNLSTRKRLELFIKVCQAVQHAHQKGIIHRDLKPSNILVTLTDGVAVPKVIDFGIAKATRGKLTDQTFFTALEQFIGTPAYMSPEQADAREVDIDTRSDIYSLGVLLYELLTGRTPFDAKTLLQGGLEEIRRTVREKEPAAPSTQLSTLQGSALSAIAKLRGTDAPQLLSQVRGDLDWIVMKALEKDRTRRYETTNALAQDIRRYLGNEPITARPPSWTYQFQKLVRRNRLAFAAAATIVLALAMGVAISVWASLREHRARLEADRQRLQAQANEQKAEAAEAKAEAAAAKSRQVAQFLEDMLNGVGPSVAKGADTTLLKKILDTTSKRIATDLTNQPEVEADLCNTLGEVYWEICDLTNAEAMYQRALDLRRTLGQQSFGLPESIEGLSHVFWREGKLAEAESLADAGLNLEIQIYGTNNLMVARSLDNLATIMSTKGFMSKALFLERQSLGIKEAVLGHDNLEVADSLNELGGLLFSMHSSLLEAEAVSHEGQAIREKILGPNDPMVLMTSLRIQVMEMDREGRSSEEEAALYKLVALKRQIDGDEHADVAQSLNTLASVLKSNDKLAESETIRRRALAIQEKALGGENAEVAQTLENLGDLLVLEHKLAESEPLLRHSYTLRRKMFGDHNALTATALIDYGTLLEEEGRIADVTNLYLSLADGASACALSAQYRLGLMYLEGKAVPRNDVAGAAWVLQSAKLGHTDAQVKMGVLCFNGTGVPKDEKQALEWFQAAAASDNASATRALANCYCAAGRFKEAISTLKNYSNNHPQDTDVRLTLAAWLAWFGKTSGYETTRQQFVKWAQNTQDAPAAQSAAKAYCLKPSTNTVLLAQALELAQRGVKFRAGTPWLPWYQLSLGMVQYRMGNYAEAEQNFSTAAQNAGKFQDLFPTASLFRAMCLFHENHPTEARQFFTEAETQMTPLPNDPDRPVVDGKTATHDAVVSWLAYREAKSLLYPAPTSTNGL
jgi:serine/threonine protein kinase/TPR repeat protein